MYVVHIYAETDSTAPKSQERIAGYVLECTTASGHIVTKEHFEKKTGTYHAVILRTLIDAMERINQSCEIHVHTQNDFILESLVSNLPGWASNGYRAQRGTLIKNCQEWQRLWELVKKQLVIKDPGTHQYYNWMQEEMKKVKKAAAPSEY